jgi:hypothetical protein
MLKKAFQETSQVTPYAFRRTALAVLLSTPLAAAQAAVFSEVEPNDTLATAQLISDPGSVQTVINGARTFSDPSDDFFRFSVAPSSSLQIVATSPSASADSIMGLYNAAGTLVASNDDASPGTGLSAISFQVGAGMGGLFSLGFSGFNAGLIACGAGVTSCYDTNNDFLFDTFVAGGGAGGSTGWSYTLTINQIAAPIPEPETYLLLGVGLAMVPLLRKRARRARPE